MSTTAAGLTRTHGASRAARVGVVLAFLLAAGYALVSLGELGQGFQPVLLLVLAAATILSAPWAWRGTAWARVVVIVSRLAAALTAVPAFFDPDLETFAVIMAAVWILLSVLAAALLLVTPRSAP